MSGLLIKDWKLLRRQGSFLLVALAIMGVVMFMGSKEFSSFLTSYIVFMASTSAFSSFTYDDFENGMAYLMTLPMKREAYVKEKYLFGILLILCSWGVGMLFRMVCFLFRFSLAEYLELLPAEPVYLLLALIYVECAIPLLLKFGGEKGRTIVTMSLVGVMFSIFMAAKYAVRIPLLAKLVQMATASIAVLNLSLLAVCLLLLAVSYLISIRIIRKKEY